MKPPDCSVHGQDLHACFCLECLVNRSRGLTHAAAYLDLQQVWLEVRQSPPLIRSLPGPRIHLDNFTHPSRKLALFDCRLCYHLVRGAHFRLGHTPPSRVPLRPIARRSQRQRLGGEYARNQARNAPLVRRASALRRPQFGAHGRHSLPAEDPSSSRAHRWGMSYGQGQEPRLPPFCLLRSTTAFVLAKGYQQRKSRKILWRPGRHRSCRW